MQYYKQIVLEKINEPFKSLKTGNFMKNTILTALPECHCADALSMDGVP